MQGITDADRDAARMLRETLADLSGFWHKPGDDSALCTALARHRIEAEQRLIEKLTPFLSSAVPVSANAKEKRATSRDRKAPSSQTGAARAA
jgi:hypothetical protein